MKGTTLRYLDASEVRASRPQGSARLRIQITGDRTVLSARVKLAFPLSEPSRFVSIQEADGKEVGILRNLEGLDEETRLLFEQQLDGRYFTPRIDRIEELRQEAGMWKFAVATQRGRTEFYVRNWRDNATEIAPGRWQIHSVDGGRFEILQLEALDVVSRRLMDQLI